MLIEARLFDAAIGDFPEHLDPLLKRIFQARGIVDSAALDRQLSCLPQPAKMQGIAAAVARLSRALAAQQRVLIVGDFDADTGFAIKWFELNGLKAGDYGTANNIATARGTAVESIKHAGIVDLRLHDLRHEGISRFFELGLSVPEVAVISGHKDFRMLARYTHLRAEDLVAKI